jgi:PAS domain S-box-containing protein
MDTAPKLDTAVRDDHRSDDTSWYPLALAENGAMLWKTDLRTRMTVGSAGAERLWGFRSGPAEQFHRQTHPEDLERLRKAWRWSVEACDDYQVQYRVLRPNGLRWYQTWGHPLRDANGEIACIVGITMDCTAQRFAESAAAEADRRLQELADAMPCPVWVRDGQGRNVYLNEAWRRFTGARLEDGLGDGWLGFVHPDDLPAHRRRWLKAQHDRAPFQSAYRLRGADGHYRPVVVRGVPVRGAGGEVQRWYFSALEAAE